MPGDVQWWYRKKVTERGPLPAARLAELIRTGEVDESTPVSTDGLTWRPLRDVPAADRPGAPPKPAAVPPPPAAPAPWWAQGDSPLAKPAPPPPRNSFPTVPVAPPPPPPPQPPKPKPAELSPPQFRFDPPAPPPPAPPPIELDFSPQPEALVPVPAEPFALRDARRPALRETMHPHEIQGVIAWTATEAYARMHTGRRILWWLWIGLPPVTLAIPLGAAAMFGGGGACVAFPLILLGLVWIPGLYLRVWRWLRAKHERRIHALGRSHSARMARLLKGYLAEKGRPADTAVVEILPDFGIVLADQGLFCWADLEAGRFCILDTRKLTTARLEKQLVGTRVEWQSETREWDVSFNTGGASALFDILLGGSLLSFLPSYKSKGVSSGGVTTETALHEYTVHLETTVPQVGMLAIWFGTNKKAAEDLYGRFQSLIHR